MMNNSKVKSIIESVNSVLIGKNEEVKLAIVTLLARGHLLLEDIPGVGKTTLAKAIASSIGCDFSRIQFTPDTLPGDVTGITVYNPKENEFRYVKGAIMSSIVLADEINRTSPKTQSSLLEAMEEGQVTVDGNTYPLEKPFMVIATQNPIEFLGTYNLPEAQLDRFMMRLSIGYPDKESEKKLTIARLNGCEKITIKEQITKEELISMQSDVDKVNINEDVMSYIVRIISQTRDNQSIELGASPRATIALSRACMALAYIEGRDYVIPDDVKALAVCVLSHRIVLSVDARINGTDTKDIIEKILKKTPVPVL